MVRQGCDWVEARNLKILLAFQLAVERRGRLQSEPEISPSAAQKIDACSNALPDRLSVRIRNLPASFLNAEGSEALGGCEGSIYGRSAKSAREPRATEQIVRGSKLCRRWTQCTQKRKITMKLNPVANAPMTGKAHKVAD